MNVNQKLNNFICERGIKQSYIAEQTGISKDAISKILRGKRKITADEFLRICNSVQIDPNIFRAENTNRAS